MVIVIISASNSHAWCRDGSWGIFGIAFELPFRWSHPFWWRWNPPELLFFNEHKLQFPIDKLKDSKTKLIFTAHFLSGPSCLKHGSRHPALTTIERYKFRYFLANGKRSSCFEQPPPAVFSCPFSWRSELHIRHSICNTMMWLKFKAWTRMKPCVGRLDYFSYQL